MVIGISGTDRAEEKEKRKGKRPECKKPIALCSQFPLDPDKGIEIIGS